MSLSFHHNYLFLEVDIRSHRCIQGVAKQQPVSFSFTKQVSFLRVQDSLLSLKITVRCFKIIRTEPNLSSTSDIHRVRMFCFKIADLKCLKSKRLRP